MSFTFQAHDQTCTDISKDFHNKTTSGIRVMIPYFQFLSVLHKASQHYMYILNFTTDSTSHVCQEWLTFVGIDNIGIDLLFCVYMYKLYGFRFSLMPDKEMKMKIVKNTTLQQLYVAYTCNDNTKNIYFLFLFHMPLYIFFSTFYF